MKTMVGDWILLKKSCATLSNSSDTVKILAAKP